MQQINKKQKIETHEMVNRAIENRAVEDIKKDKEGN